MVSNNFSYGKFAVLDTTDYMRHTLPIWRNLGFRFDAICTGLMFSEEQACLVAAYCRHLSAEGCSVFVDPIMGDSGHLYNGISDRHVQLMREMVSVADLTFPNYTEACYLTGIPYCEGGMTWDEACRMLDGVAALGARSVLITSARIDGQTCVIGRRSEESVAGFRQRINEGPYFRLDYDEIPKAFHGTGDIFSAVLIGHLLKGEPLRQSTQTAMNVVSSLIERNIDQKDLCLGIPIEQCLDIL